MVRITHPQVFQHWPCGFGVPQTDPQGGLQPKRRVRVSRDFAAPKMWGQGSSRGFVGEWSLPTSNDGRYLYWGRWPFPMKRNSDCQGAPNSESSIFLYGNNGSWSTRSHKCCKMDSSFYPSSTWGGKGKKNPGWRGFFFEFRKNPTLTWMSQEVSKWVVNGL